MSMLRYYCGRVTSTRGLEHKITLNNLRSYIKETPVEQLIDSINHMHDLAYLRALWESGLNMELQNAVTRRLEELTTRRE